MSNLGIDRRLAHPLWRHIPQRLVRPHLVVVADVRLHDVVQVVKTEAEEVVEALPFEAADPSQLAIGATKGALTTSTPVAAHR